MMLWRGMIGARATLSVLATAMLVVPSGAFAQDQRSHRDEWQKVDEIVVALDLEEGERVADIGAGRGFFTLRLARVVGPGGRVFAVDIDEGALEQLRTSVRRAGLENVETIVSEPDDPMLPDTSVDAALMVIAYHEMREHEAMLAGIKRALRPGGRLAIVDNPVSDSTDSRRQQMRRHHIDIKIVEQDLIAAGFEILERLPRFVDMRDEGHTHRNWMLVARPIDDQPGPQRAALGFLPSCLTASPLSLAPSSNSGRCARQTGRDCSLGPLILSSGSSTRIQSATRSTSFASSLPMR